MRELFSSTRPLRVSRARRLISFCAYSIAYSAAYSAFGTLVYVPSAQANVVSTDAQNFNPTTSGLDFVSVHSSETLKPGIVNLGLFLNYAVNSLPYLESGSQNRLNFNDTLLGLDLNAGIGIMEGWDVGVSLPQILRQSVEDTSGGRGQYEQTGSTEVRLNSKVRLMGDDSGGVALIGSVNFNRIESNPYVGVNPGPTLNFEVAADTTVDRIALGANLGYRLRNPGSTLPGSLVQPLKDQLIASAAASYHVPEWNSKFIGEVFGSLPVERTSSNYDRSLSSLEALLGIKHDLNMNLAAHAGLSAGLASGIASPDWRVYTGINYAFGPVFERESNTTTADRKASRPLLETVETTASGQVSERFRTQSILFEFDSDQMVGKFHEALAELASYLKSGFRELVVEGHTDSIGAAAYNERLSERRAAAIKRYLVSRFGIDERKIKTLGYGESRPIADNGNYQGRQLNRRVEFEIRR